MAGLDELELRLLLLLLRAVHDLVTRVVLVCLGFVAADFGLDVVVEGRDVGECGEDVELRDDG